MTTEELIIGHFEGTLDGAEAAHLRNLLDTSPDARALFENHESLHTLLRADVAALVPAAPLASNALTAALQTPAEQVTETALGWGFGQIAVGLGGISAIIGAFVLSSRAPQPAATPQAAPVPAVAPAFTMTPVAPNPPVVEETRSSTRTTSPSRTVVEPRRPAGRSVRATDPNQRNMKLEDPRTHIQKDPTLRGN